MGAYKAMGCDSGNASGLWCSRCHSFFCKPCLQGILQATNLNPDSDKWAGSVSAFLRLGHPQPSFIGSCCEFRLLNKLEKVSLPTPSIKSSPPPSENIPSYDGFLHYPDYNLLVESNFESIDILALGAQPGLDPGVLHGLVRPADALVFQEAGVIASGSGMTISDSFEETLVLANPENDCETESFRVNVVIVSHTGSSDAKAGGHPTAEAIAKAGIIAMDNKKFDATIVLGEPANKEASYYVLVARLHSMEIHLSNDESSRLQKHLETKLKKGGLEGRRVGGSGGKAVVNENLLKFLHHPGNFPRKGKGVKFVANDNQWSCFYISPYKAGHQVAFVPYSQPQPGGSMTMTDKDISAFPFLRTFAESKPLAALLLQAVNEQVLKGGRLCFKPPIERELEHLSMARSSGHTCKEELLDYLVMLNKHTMVAYPVGYHRDVFADKKAALENRICFRNIRRSQRRQQGPALGRGGAGAGVYCWALLDWPLRAAQRPRRPQTRAQTAASAARGAECRVQRRAIRAGLTRAREAREAREREENSL
jgi:hypothetical protein